MPANHSHANFSFSTCAPSAAQVDVDENEEVAAFAGISAMPTFQVYKDGKKVGELMGAAKDKLLGLVEAHK